ncbi:Annexin [Durotheca rogersii]|uniref:Annexin n=1 Tax=Durotheca rogersii TaxID=419775 RepID=UPI00221FE6CC|nr:Annexin [Durotheca rogersii]KAI5856732.1 Annexin [Durotheca rogersii]
MNPPNQHYYGQYPPAGGPPLAGQPQPGHQPPPQGSGSYPPYTPPPGASAALGLPPYSNYNAPQGPPQPGQYQPQPYPGGASSDLGGYPPGQAKQYPNQPYPHQPTPQGQYGQLSALYEQYPPNPYPYQAPNANPRVPAPPGQWPQPHVTPQGYGVPPTPASPGYDPAQKAFYAPIDTSADAEAIRKAMKGMGCNEAELIRVFTAPKYDNPWALAQLVDDYNKRFIRDLKKDIESETRGDLETALLALIRGPLEHDVRVLIKALDRIGTDEGALMDVLLCRSNADIRAITAEYKRIKGKELLIDIKNDVDDALFRLYSMVLSATRAEDSAPLVAVEIDQKVTELQRATEGTFGANVVSVVQIFTSSNAAQLRAISEAYQRKYHRSLEHVIEKEFRGDMEDALLYMLDSANDQARSDARRLETPLCSTPRKDRLFINRVVSLHWDRNRLDQAKAAYHMHSQLRASIRGTVRTLLSGDYENLILALLRERQ